MAEWDKPGSFTIKAETVAAVASASGSSEVSSMFGITVEMGGDRFYDSAIFETDVVALDVATASLPFLGIVQHLSPLMEQQMLTPQ